MDQIEKQDVKWISDLVGALTDPIITWPSPWMEDIPDRLKDRVPIERLIMCARAQMGETPTATDVEALIYMFPRTLEATMDRDWVDIYVYLGNKVCSAMGQEMPEDIRRDTLDEQQMRDLNHLKAWIYDKRIAARLDRDRAGRRQKKEDEAERKKQEQPALFDF
ncbi:unnamed protein product [marine sediment metagenome]|uniref:Uncharacterized protein n=1 Tax=marine sediment metagenome TaxID=412755 RepID=X1GW74_9ZZZZ